MYAMDNRPRIILNFILTFALLVNSFPAGAVDGPKLAPLRLSWCESMLANHKSEQAYSGSSLYSLREAKFATDQAIAALKGKPKALSARLSDLKVRLFGQNRDFSVPHLYPVRTLIEDTDRLKALRANEIHLERLLGRMILLEEDVTSLKAGNISFGQEIVGKDGIQSYLLNLKLIAESLDVENSRLNETENPYINRQRIIRNLASATLGAYSAYIALLPMVSDILQHNWYMLLPQALVATIFYQVYHRGVRESFAYFKGLLDKDSRIAYENSYNPQRAQNEVEQTVGILKILEQPQAHPNAIAYNGYAYPMSVEVVNELLAASKENRPVSQDAILTTIEKTREGLGPLDLRWIVIDQIFFIDSQTQEPVLLNFVRIKNANDFTQKKTPKKEKEVTSTQEQDIGDGVLAPVGARGR